MSVKINGIVDRMIYLNWLDGRVEVDTHNAWHSERKEYTCVADGKVVIDLTILNKTTGVFSYIKQSDVGVSILRNRVGSGNYWQTHLKVGQKGSSSFEIPARVGDTISVHIESKGDIAIHKLTIRLLPALIIPSGVQVPLISNGALYEHGSYYREGKFMKFTINKSFAWDVHNYLPKGFEYVFPVTIVEYKDEKIRGLAEVKGWSSEVALSEPAPKVKRSKTVRIGKGWKK